MTATLGSWSLKVAGKALIVRLDLEWAFGPINGFCVVHSLIPVSTLMPVIIDHVLEELSGELLL